MATKDGRTQIWYADGNGNVEGYTETVGDIAETIISTYNEHFGTDIQLWTPETKSLQVGGTVPNWNAYEKIGFILWAYEFTQNMFVAGEIQKDILFIYTPLNKTDKWIFDTAGKVSTYAPFGEPYLQNTINAVNEHFGTSFVDINDLAINLTGGEELPSWEEYEKIR